MSFDVNSFRSKITSTQNLYLDIVGKGQTLA